MLVSAHAHVCATSRSRAPQRPHLCIAVPSGTCGMGPSHASSHCSSSAELAYARDTSAAHAASRGPCARLARAQVFGMPPRRRAGPSPRLRQDRCYVRRKPLPLLLERRSPSVCRGLPRAGRRRKRAAGRWALHGATPPRPPASFELLSQSCRADTRSSVCAGDPRAELGRKDGRWRSVMARSTHKSFVTSCGRRLTHLRRPRDRGGGSSRATRRCAAVTDTLAVVSRGNRSVVGLAAYPAAHPARGRLWLGPQPPGVCPYHPRRSSGGGPVTRAGMRPRPMRGMPRLRSPGAPRSCHPSLPCARGPHCRTVAHPIEQSTRDTGLAQARMQKVRPRTRRARAYAPRKR
jgi:hypothetical protein